MRKVNLIKGDEMDVNSYFGIKNLTQVGLHKIINDGYFRVRQKVASYIDQSGLHKMIDDPDLKVRWQVVQRINQAGLHMMRNDLDPVVGQ